MSSRPPTLPPPGPAPAERASAQGEARAARDTDPATPHALDAYATRRGDQHWSRRDPGHAREVRQAQSYARGSKHHRAKLTERQAQAILDCPDESFVGADFARKFEVTPACVYAVRKRSTWRHLTPRRAPARVVLP